MTKQEAIEVYNKLITYYEYCVNSNCEGRPICIHLEYLKIDRSFRRYYLPIPNETDANRYWWDRDDMISRLDYCKKQKSLLVSELTEEENKQKIVETGMFKVGDKVFEITFGWGTIISIDYNNFNSFCVRFSNRSKSIFYDKWHAKSRLSFTEYTLTGFSQNRKDIKPDIKQGQLIYVRYPNSERYLRYWNIRYFSHWDKLTNGVHCFDIQARSYESTTLWNQYSITNPLEDDKETTNCEKV